MVVEKFNNKCPRFSDMPVMVSGADLDGVVSRSMAVWVYAFCLVLVWIWLLSGAVRSGAVLCRYLFNDICGSFLMSGYFVFLLYLTN